MRIDELPLHRLLEASAARHLEAVAVEDPSGASLTYRELDRLSGALAEHLASLGVHPGDRVAFCLPKSLDAIVSIYGILKSGAAYVPLDPFAPAARDAYIAGDCQVRVLITDQSLAVKLDPELDAVGYAPTRLVVDADAPQPRLRALLGAGPATPRPGHASSPDDLAYILYTSGSTGKPKGVMLSHRNATSFLAWCSATFRPSAADRFSSHAPLHFDLSILDVHLALQHGAALVLIPEEVGKDPVRLGPLIAEQRLTVWYSVPSILALLAQYGRLEDHDVSALRLVLFAGEVFPVKHLRALKQLWPGPRYFNLYGPTETNVCTFSEIPATIPEDRVEPFPIGRTCSHLESLVIGPDGGSVPAGAEGELCIAGSGVTKGYWNLAERTAQAFHVDERGRAWYRTGDLVAEDPETGYRYLGRRDRMVKKRGYRIELGEIEVCLLDHPAVHEAAVVATQDADAGVRIAAFVSVAAERRPSIIELKAYCAERLPIYMVPDVFVRGEWLPRTSTDKIDYQTLAGQATLAAPGGGR